MDLQTQKRQRQLQMPHFDLANMDISLVPPRPSYYPALSMPIFESFKERDSDRLYIDNETNTLCVSTGIDQPRLTLVDLNTGAFQEIHFNQQVLSIRGTGMGRILLGTEDDQGDWSSNILYDIRSGAWTQLPDQYNLLTSWELIPYRIINDIFYMRDRAIFSQADEVFEGGGASRVTAVNEYYVVFDAETRTVIINHLDGRWTYFNDDEGHVHIDGPHLIYSDVNMEEKLKSIIVPIGEMRLFQETFIDSLGGDLITIRDLDHNEGHILYWNPHEREYRFKGSYGTLALVDSSGRHLLIQTEKRRMAPVLNFFKV